MQTEHNLPPQEERNLADQMKLSGPRATEWEQGDMGDTRDTFSQPPHWVTNSPQPSFAVGPRMQDESNDDQNSARDKGQGDESSYNEEQNMKCRRHGENTLEPWPASL